MANAKDGTNRGGYRVGAGRKKKALADKILDGQVKKADVDAAKAEGSKPPANATVQSTGSITSAAVPAVTPENAIPPPRDFIGAEQKNMNGIGNVSRQIYDNTMRWIAERGCLDAVPQGLVERYAVAAARWEQCDRVISMFGIAAKHPTTNAQIASPYVSMSLQWMKP